MNNVIHLYFKFRYLTKLGDGKDKLVSFISEELDSKFGILIFLAILADAVGYATGKRK